MPSPSGLSFVERIIHHHGGKFGCYLTGDKRVAIIDQMGQFEKIAGPGLVRIDRLTQSIRGFINIDDHEITKKLEDIQTKDNVLVVVTLTVIYAANPRRLNKANAQEVVKWSDIRREDYVRICAQRALQAVVPKYYAYECISGELVDSAEPYFFNELAARVDDRGIDIRKCQIQSATLPESLIAHYQMIAQWAATMKDLKTRDPESFEQALQIEMAKIFARMNVGKAFANFPQISSKLVQEDEESSKQIGQANTRIIQPHTLPRPDIIDAEYLDDDGSKLV